MAGESWKVPTPVKDLAALVEEPPSRFVQREEDRPGSLMLAADMPDPLPIVDLNQLSTADEAANLRSALQTWGLFLVRSIPSSSSSCCCSRFSCITVRSFLHRCLLIHAMAISVPCHAGYQPWHRCISNRGSDEGVTRVFRPAAPGEAEMQQPEGRDALPARRVRQ